MLTVEREIFDAEWTIAIAECGMPSVPPSAKDYAFERFSAECERAKARHPEIYADLIRKEGPRAARVRCIESLIIENYARS